MRWGPVRVVVGAWLAAALGAQVQFAPVTGVVVDPAGAPVAGAEVELWRADGPDLRWLSGEQPSAWRQVGAVRTDRGGRFGLQGPLGSRCQLRVEHAAAAVYRESFRPAGGELRVQLQSPCTLQGHVRARDGGGLAARLAVGIDGVDWIALQTDDQGVYRFERLPPGLLRVAVEANAAVLPAHEWIELAAGQTKEHSPLLALGEAVTGRVVDAETGQPMAGAELRTGWWGATRARSDAQGRFTFPGLGGEHTLLHCVAADYVTCRWRAKPEAPTAAEMRLHRGTTVQGTVLDEHGRPITGASLWSLGVEASTQTYYQYVVCGRTDEAGQYCITGNGYDESTPIVVVTAPDRAIVVRQGAHKGMQLDIPPVTLPMARLLRGTAVTAGGRPVSGVKVGLWGGNDDRWNEPRFRALCRRSHYPSEMIVGWRFTKTDASGCFAFGELPPGTYDLEFCDEHGKVLELLTDLVVTAADPRPLQVTLPK